MNGFRVDRNCSTYLARSRLLERFKHTTRARTSLRQARYVTIVFSLLFLVSFTAPLPAQAGVVDSVRSAYASTVSWFVSLFSRDSSNDSGAAPSEPPASPASESPSTASPESQSSAPPPTETRSLFTQVLPTGAQQPTPLFTTIVNTVNERVDDARLADMITRAELEQTTRSFLSNIASVAHGTGNIDDRIDTVVQSYLGSLTGSFSTGSLSVAGESNLATTTITGGLTVNGNTNITEGGQLTVGDKIIAPGEIGLGTSSPSAKLTVQSTNPLQTAVFIVGTSTQTNPLLDILSDTNASLFRVSANGDIGIGTTSPVSTLDVWGDFRVGTSSTPLLFADVSTGRVQVGGGGGTGPATLFDVTALPGAVSNDYTSDAAAAVGNGGLFRIGDFTASNGKYVGLNISSISSSGINQTTHIGSVSVSGGGTPITVFGHRVGGSYAERMRITNAGHLGIGTTTVNARLAVQTTGTTDILNLFETGGTEVFTVLESGNVGIGTTGPGSRLDVRSSDVTFTNNTRGILNIASTDAQSSGRGGSLTFSGYRDSAASSHQVWAVIEGNKENSLDFHSQGYLSFSTSLSGPLVEAMRITSAGNVGISTTSPYARLSVAGNAHFDGSVTLSSLIATTSISAPYLATTDAVATSTFAGGFSVGTTAFNVLQNGRVGIGTTTPTTLLQVSGEVKAESASFGGTASNKVQISSFGNLVLNGSVLQSSGATLSGSSFYGLTGLYSFGGVIRATNALNFQTNNSSVSSLYIHSAGNIGISTTSPSARLSITQSANTSAGGIWLAANDDTDFRSAYMNDTGVLSFYGGDTAGTLNTATLNAAGEWTNASDIAYKDTVQNLSYGLEEVLALTPRSYFLKNTNDHRIGFIAQEVELVIPEVVGGTEGSKGISYGNLVAVVVKAIQELAQKVNGFAVRITTGILDAGAVNTDNLNTDTLCVGSVCVTEAEFGALLDKQGQQSATPPPSPEPPEEGAVPDSDEDASGPDMPTDAEELEDTAQDAPVEDEESQQADSLDDSVPNDVSDEAGLDENTNADGDTEDIDENEAP